MARTLRTLLNRALYLSVSDRKFSPIEPDGSEINDAADIFSLVIDQYREQIPYQTETQLNGENELLNVNMATVNYVNYLLGNIPYPLTPLNQYEFSRINRLLNLRTIPEYYWHDKANNAIRVYPLPQKSTDIFLVGFKPIIDSSRIDNVLPSSITPFMEKFLIYQCASDLCDQYNIPWSVKKQNTLTIAYEDLLKNSQLKPSKPFKPRLARRGSPVPWLAYLSGNIPSN